eukprot:NODE_2634_length_1072_cov_49.966764_g2195_i0.p2 GENE.NODE_2634_length_1072_cov_49.966764_g2195_i0~~NODE_2634_length_1072_cov_49.966764_g2195_i0.p2  ORF type:complete len:207 (+),score=54.18 NODE_2634_length_1072_cov_49.966764_g2195_i0:221-841(+)
MDSDDGSRLDRLLDAVRSHDADRRNEIGQLRQQVQMLQQELNKRAATIKHLQAQVHKLTDFKRSILRSVKDPNYGDANESFGLTDPAAEDFTLGGVGDAGPSSYPPSGAAGASTPAAGGAAAGGGSYDKDYQDGREFFIRAQRELSKDAYKQFLSVLGEFNKAHVSILPFDQANQQKQKTLNEVRKIFGPHNDNLFQAFCVMMARQ